MNEAERWAKVGKRIDEIRGTPQRNGLDVGGFFDRSQPSPWRWIVPAVLAVAYFAIAAWSSNGATFHHGFSCALGIVWGVERFSEAVKAWRAGR